MKIIGLVNPAAGSVSRDGLARLKSLLESLGHGHAELHELDLADCSMQMAELAAMDPDLMIVWGGDGTLRTALSVIGKTTPNLVLLPGGTMNVLCNALHGAKPWHDVLRSVIDSPRRRTLSAGKIEDQVFYCAMLAGAPARMAEARESLRTGDIGAAAVAARAALDTLQSIHLTARLNAGYAGDERLPSTSIIGALVGPLSKSPGMEVAALADPSALGALNVVWQSFLTDWRNAPGVTVISAKSLTIENETDDPIPAIIDGEKLETGRRLQVDYVEEAAQCLVAA